MQEDFLHHVWQYQKFKSSHELKTNQGENLQILSVGQHNQNQSGPDFFNAKIKIGTQTWAGNVEIHLKSSDWYAHQHENDPAYDNVILHVIWDDDIEIYRKDNSIIPSLSLKDIVNSDVFDRYEQLLKIKPQQINCEKNFANFDDFILQNWLERVYVERLERKSELILKLLHQNQNNWEAVLFQLLCKNFGLNVNGSAFLELSKTIPYIVIAKHYQKIEDLEALLLGQSSLLSIETETQYIKTLQQRYQYLKHKYQLRPAKEKPQFFRLRPDNFPSLRLAELAAVYHRQPQLFQNLIATQDKNEIYKLFDIELPEFWKTHYSLTKKSKPKPKRLSQNFINLLIINTIVPLKFCYQKQTKNQLNYDNLFNLISDLKSEHNSKVEVFENLRPNTNQNAMYSQALLQLKTEYCDKNYCLKCHLGKRILNQSV
ncbi:DUF2851 family protein [Mesohalobacter halotolerans]|uniref:DUF2851 family protein n=1 Tax=Mesohalobacter halotolerans TaxID=1883405 RepID=A0A4U5TRP1_9FLAO|nr:DUF2851 family protein [Mesohalobacter halotolerans]MBS3737962.1 DUF2851 family protein [Psychroflexus sp.]TKS56054.1 DUF2851 family protein [Mesohalobacter halotolerans]